VALFFSNEGSERKGGQEEKENERKKGKNYLLQTANATGRRGDIACRADTRARAGPPGRSKMGVPGGGTFGKRATGKKIQHGKCGVGVSRGFDKIK